MRPPCVTTEVVGGSGTGKLVNLLLLWLNACGSTVNGVEDYHPDRPP